PDTSISARNNLEDRMTSRKSDVSSTPATEFALARRRLVLGGLAGIAGSALVSAPAFVRAQARQPLKVLGGRLPWAAGNSPVTQYMINNKLFEKRAAEQGYDLTIDWRDYPTAMPMVEAVV